jgi:hypothetical protein
MFAELPISRWALVAGLLAGGVTILLVRAAAIPTATPPAVVWLGMWATLFVLQAAWWALSRKRTRITVSHQED